MAGPKIPRASISIGHWDDPAFQHLRSLERGWEAWGIFVALITRAKSMRNDGVFKLESNGIQTVFKTISNFLGCTSEQLQHCVKLTSECSSMFGSKPWLIVTDKSLSIRSFLKWNDARGGVRENAGRKPNRTTSKESKRNQTVIKEESNGNQSGHFESPSVSVSVTKEEPAKAGADKPPRKLAWNHELVQSMQSRIAEPHQAKLTQELFKLTNRLARTYTQRTVQMASARCESMDFENLDHLTRYLSATCVGMHKQGGSKLGDSDEWQFRTTGS